MLGEQNTVWKNIMYSMLNISSEMFNRNIVYTKFAKCRSKFHEQIMISWNMAHNNRLPTKTIEIFNQNILYNQLIQINNKHITERYIGVNNNNQYIYSLKMKDIILMIINKNINSLRNQWQSWSENKKMELDGSNISHSEIMERKII